jgi:hypothetical protein
MMESADAILREFVADVLAANSNDYEEAVYGLERDWPDLAVTFKRAYKFVGDIGPEPYREVGWLGGK